MSRIIDYRTLCSHLEQVQSAIGLCPADGKQFALDAEQLSDARWRICQQIAALERLERSLVGQNITPKPKPARRPGGSAGGAKGANVSILFDQPRQGVLLL